MLTFSVTQFTMVPEVEDKAKHRNSDSSLSDSFDSLSLESQTSPTSKSPVSFLKRLMVNGKADIKSHLGSKKRHGKENSVRPSPEEASKWANSLDDLLASKYGQALFKAFLQTEFCEENLEFWLAVEDYRKSSQSKLPAKAQSILNQFIIPESPKEINIDSVSRENLIDGMTEVTHSTFDQVQKRIRNIIEEDAFIRFLKSDLYMELVHPDDYLSDDM